MDRDELLTTLEEAKEHMLEAIALLDTYVRESDDQNADAYIVAHLKILASADHGYVSRGRNVDDLINKVKAEGAGAGLSPAVAAIMEDAIESGEIWELDYDGAGLKEHKFPYLSLDEAMELADAVETWMDEN